MRLSTFRSLFAWVLFGTLTACSALPPKQVFVTAKTNDVVEVPQQRFRIQSTGNGPEARYGMVDSVQPHSKWLAFPSLPHIENSTCPGPEFSVSPDGDWIVADEKLYRGANEVWLLHRDSPFHCSLVFPSFSRAAWSYYAKASGRRFHLDRRYIVRAGPWPQKDANIRLTLYGESSHSDEEPVEVALCFNLNTLTFTMAEDQTTKYY